MKRGLSAVMAMVLGFSLITVAGYAGEPQYSGFLGDCYKDLQPGPEGGAKMRWLKPGVDFSKYNKVMIDNVTFYFANDSEDKGIDSEQMKELSDAFDLELVSALKDKYPIVSEPGPDVVRIKVAITGVKKSKPVISTVTSVMPIGLGVSILKKGATGSWAGSGGTSGEMMMLDSSTNDVIAVAVDERSAGFTERFTTLGATKEAFKVWAEKLRKFLDDAHGVKAQ